MTQEEKDKVLDKPFGQAETPAGEPAKEPIKTEEVKPEEVVELEKPRVPYSRFENVSKARREAEAEADKWRQRAIELEEQRFTHKTEAPTGETPSYWLKLYGDTPEVREAWKLYQENQPTISPEKIREEALQAFRAEQVREKEAEKENLSTLDEHLDAIGAIAGHDLTEKEQSEFLDIIDEFTPKDDDGNYLGGILSPDKAYEIYELKRQNATSASRQSRDGVAAAINSPSNGQPSLEKQEADKNWRPWAYRDKLPKE